MTEKISGRMQKIRNIEDKYGLLLFRMSFICLIDTGIERFRTEGYAENCISQIMAQGEEEKVKDVVSAISPETQCNILRCAAELSEFSPLTLLKYVREHVFIGD